MAGTYIDLWIYDTEWISKGRISDLWKLSQWNLVEVTLFSWTGFFLIGSSVKDHLSTGLGLYYWQVRKKKMNFASRVIGNLVSFRLIKWQIFKHSLIYDVCIYNVSCWLWLHMVVFMSLIHCDISHVCLLQNWFSLLKYCLSDSFNNAVLYVFE